MVKFRNPYGIRPPGTAYEILAHPYYPNSAIELAIFQEHRYAFYFWNKWNRKNKNANAPCLVTFDWHQDLCFPCDTEKKWLEKLDTSNDADVSVFCWAKLAGNNDGHILCAAYLNLIGNIYVLCRQGTFPTAWEDEELIDKFGNQHLIKKFKTKEALEEYLLGSDEENVFFDIDLDYFSINNPYNGKGKKFTYMSDMQIKKLLDIESDLINWIFQRLQGFTIATEPEHCGGILKSNMFLGKISSLYFEPELFHPDCKWKHQKTK